MVNIFGFVGHIGSVTTTQCCHCSTDNMGMDGHNDVPVNFHLQKQAHCGFHTSCFRLCLGTLDGFEPVSDIK